MSARGKTTSLGGGLRKLMSRLDKQGHMTTASVIDVWDALVGPEIAQHTNIEGLRGTELLVAVDSPVWANELQAMAAQLVERLQQELSNTPVKTMRFTVTKFVSQRRVERAAEEDSQGRYSGQKVEPVALSAEELAAVERSVAGIENESLKDAALKATVRDLERKKGQERLNTSEKAPGASSGTKTGF